MAQHDATRLELVCRRPEAPEGYTFVAAHVSAGGEGLFLFVADDAVGDVRGRDKRGGASFPRTRMPLAKAFQLIVVHEGQTTTIKIPPLDIAHPYATLFPDGRVLLAAARCQWRGPNDHDLNGVIFDPANGSVKRLLLGDGIADVAVDARGRIWVSYFDEGVFGNRGWNHPGPPGPGAGGLVCFDATGQQLFVFNADYEAGIDDCYALNATPDAMWACYYMGFDLCRVDADFTRTTWKPGVSGAHAVAVSDVAFLFSAQYGESADTVHLVKREGGQLKTPRVIRVQTPDGSPLEWQDTKVTGRGPYLNFLNENGWWRADVRRFVTG